MSGPKETLYLNASAPCPLVADIHLAIRCWRDDFEFTSDEVWGNFTIMHRDGVHVMLREVPAGVEVISHWQVASQMWDAYIWVNDAQAMYREMVERGATIDYELHEKDYGVRRARGRLQPSTFSPRYTTIGDPLAISSE